MSRIVHGLSGMTAAMLLTLSGCGGTGDVGLGVGGGDASPDSGLGGDTATANAPFLVVDLTSGTRRTEAAIADLTTSAAYRSSSMVFRRVRGAAGETWMGVFEVTQAQWQVLAGSGSTPWTSVPAVVFASAQDATDAVADDKPAFNLSYDGVQTAITAFNAAKGTRLAIPSVAQWTDACAAGSTHWSWGDDSARTTIAAHAVVRETQSGVTGPRTVGGRSANASGCYDMHGNVWELTSPAVTLCGGSWYDGVVQARADNHPDSSATGLAPTSSYALVGVRLIFQP